MAGPADPAADVRIGLAHSPSRGCSTGSPPTATTCCSAGTPTAASCGCPFYGALVTNCGIDRDRVRWLHRWAEPAPGRPGRTWLHVSAGLGTSPYAPVRFACPPEATLLTLTARAA